MAISDQFNTEPVVLLGGSYSDRVSVGNTLSLQTDTYMTTVAEVDITQSVTPFLREVVASHVNGTTQKLKEANILYSDRIRFKNGRARGSRNQSTFVQGIDSQETFFDSLVPNPIDIATRNGVVLAYLTPASGALDASSEHFGLPASAGDIPIFFGDSVPASLVGNEDVIDTQWLQSPFPFQSKYKQLKRVLKPSFFLAEPRSIGIDFSTGDSMVPVSQSNVVGTVYYVSDQVITGFNNQLFFGEYDFLGSVFTEGEFPTVVDFGIELLTEWNGTDSTSFPKVFQTSLDQQMLCGSDGIIVRRQQGVSGWSLVQGIGISSDLYAVAHSRGTNFFGTSQFGSWVFVGAGGTILYSTRVDGGSLASATPGGGFAGSFHGVCNLYTSSGPSGIFVAVGENGNIHYSSDYTGSGTWTQVIVGGGTPTLYAVDYNYVLSRFVAVGSGGRIYVSTDAITWSLVSSIGNLLNFTDDLYTVKCHFSSLNGMGLEGMTVVAGANGALAVHVGSSLTTESQWTVVASTPAGAGLLNGYSGDFRASARGAEVDNGGGRYTFYVAGDDGMIMGGSDFGSTTQWTVFTPTPEASGVNFRCMTSMNFWPSREWNDTGDFLVAGHPRYIEFESIGRVVDIETPEYAYDDTSERFINNGELMSLNSAGLPAGAKYVRSKMSDSLKTYFGFGPGASLQLDGNFTPNNYTFLPRTSVQFEDVKVFTGTTAMDTLRFVAPKPSGFRYGVLNVEPQATKCMFRRDKFGHPRDMLEQRASSKVLLTTNGNTTVGDAVVKVEFVTGSLAYERAINYQSVSSSQTYNPTDSGIYDAEYRSGMPFFDNSPGGTGEYA